MFEYAHYRWKDDPADGEYELQFDRFETSERENPNNQVVLLIVDETGFVGDVVLPTADVPEITPDEQVGTAIFCGTIRDGEIVALTYDPELTKQGIKEAKESYNRVRSSSDKDR